MARGNILAKKQAYVILTIKANEMHCFSNLIDKVLYMCRTVHHQEYLNTVYRQ